MAAKEIALLGDPILRTRVQEAWKDQFDTAGLQKLAADLTDTMRAANGVGIAAPQISEAARLIAIEIRAGNRYGVTELLELTLIQNPEVEAIGDETMEIWEGCLSIPTLRGPVTRSSEIVLRGLDLAGNPLELPMSGFPAVVAQHEVDHIEGVLFIDRMTDLKLLSLETEFRRYHDETSKADDAETGSDAG